MVTVLTSKNFNEEAVETQDTVLIDFWASWCGPCRMLSPVIDEIGEEGHPGLKVCKVNVDEESELAVKFGVMSIPTLIVMRGGKVVNKSVGVIPKEAVLDLIK